MSDASFARPLIRDRLHARRGSKSGRVSLAALVTIDRLSGAALGLIFVAVLLRNPFASIP